MHAYMRYNIRITLKSTYGNLIVLVRITFSYCFFFFLSSPPPLPPLAFTFHTIFREFCVEFLLIFTGYSGITIKLSLVINILGVYLHVMYMYIIYNI